MALISKKSAPGGPIQSGRKVSGKGKESGHKGHDEHEALGAIQSGKAGSVKTHSRTLSGASMVGHTRGPSNTQALQSGKAMSNPLAKAFSAPDQGMPERLPIGKKGGVV